MLRDTKQDQVAILTLSASWNIKYMMNHGFGPKCEINLFILV